MIRAPSARADTLQAYNLAWTGLANNGVAINGTMTLDLTTLPNPSFVADIYNDIAGLSITVTGAGVSNGTYTKADLCNTCGPPFYTAWTTGPGPSSINMNGDVLAQLLLNGGDFNLWFAHAGPRGDGQLTLRTAGGAAQMTEFQAVTTPEPASLALMSGGLLMLALAVSRKRGLRAGV